MIISLHAGDQMGSRTSCMRERLMLMSSDGNEPERLMYPFTISTSGGPNARSYTLCTA